jgi:hypothetical protein
MKVRLPSLHQGCKLLYFQFVVTVADPECLEAVDEYLLQYNLRCIVVSCVNQFCVVGAVVLVSVQ